MGGIYAKIYSSFSVDTDNNAISICCLGNFPKN